jgi:hypothetical protein
MNPARMLAAALLAGTPSVAADADMAMKPGLFEVKGKGADPTGVVDFKSLAIVRTKDGFAIANKDAPGSWELLGTVKNGGSITLPAAGTGSQNAVLTVSKPGADGSLAASIKRGDVKVDFRLEAAAHGGLYRCGNHGTPHMATGVAEMRELQKAHGCENWKSLLATGVLTEKLANVVDRAAKKQP